jgi:hypothetical protein
VSPSSSQTVYITWSLIVHTSTLSMRPHLPLKHQLAIHNLEYHSLNTVLSRCVWTSYINIKHFTHIIRKCLLQW